MADRIAVISDIHGNLTALTRVLADIGHGASRASSAWATSSARGHGLPNAPILASSSCEKTVKGNWDHLATTWADRSFMRWHREALGRTEPTGCTSSRAILNSA